MQRFGSKVMAVVVMIAVALSAFGAVPIPAAAGSGTDAGTAVAAGGGAPNAICNSYVRPAVSTTVSYYSTILYKKDAWGRWIYLFGRGNETRAYYQLCAGTYKVVISMPGGGWKDCLEVGTGGVSLSLSGSNNKLVACYQ